MGIKYILKRLLAEWKSNMWLAIELLIVSVVIWIIADQLYVVNSRMNEDRGLTSPIHFLFRLRSLERVLLNIPLPIAVIQPAVQASGR